MKGDRLYGLYVVPGEGFDPNSMILARLQMGPLVGHFGSSTPTSYMRITGKAT